MEEVATVLPLVAAREGSFFILPHMRGFSMEEPNLSRLLGVTRVVLWR